MVQFFTLIFRILSYSATSNVSSSFHIPRENNNRDSMRVFSSQYCVIVLIVFSLWFVCLTCSLINLQRNLCTQLLSHTFIKYQTLSAAPVLWSSCENLTNIEIYNMVKCFICILFTRRFQEAGNPFEWWPIDQTLLLMTVFIFTCIFGVKMLYECNMVCYKVGVQVQKS